MPQTPNGWATWRYQPVVDFDAGSEAVVSLIAVFVDGEGRLKAWSAEETHGSWPCGETPKELVMDLCRMIANAGKYKPVWRKDLRVGMTFEETGVNVDQIVDCVKALGGDVAD